MANERLTGKTSSSGGEAAGSTLPPGVRLLRRLEGHKGSIRSVAFDSQGRTLASGSVDNTVKFWDAASGKLLRSLEGHKDYVRSVAFDPQGRTLASGSDDGTVKLWDAVSGKLLRSLDAYKSTVWNVAFDWQGHTLASGTSDLRAACGRNQWIIKLALLV